MCEQNENINKQNYKKKPSKILQLKSIIIEMRNSVEGFSSIF